ncbi:hypothetical protein ACOMHN_006334 [Nucella lapillus]
MWNPLSMTTKESSSSSSGQNHWISLETRIARVVNDLRKKVNNQKVAKAMKNLLRRWQSIVMKSPTSNGEQQSPNSPQAGAPAMPLSASSNGEQQPPNSPQAGAPAMPLSAYTPWIRDATASPYASARAELPKTSSWKRARTDFTARQAKHRRVDSSGLSMTHKGQEKAADGQKKQLGLADESRVKTTLELIQDLQKKTNNYTIGHSVLRQLDEKQTHKQCQQTDKQCQQTDKQCQQTDKQGEASKPVPADNSQEAPNPVPSPPPSSTPKKKTIEEELDEIYAQLPPIDPEAAVRYMLRERKIDAIIAYRHLHRKQSGIYAENPL